MKGDLDESHANLHRKIKATAREYDAENTVTIRLRRSVQFD
jgi:hypothetical protein